MICSNLHLRTIHQSQSRRPRSSGTRRSYKKCCWPIAKPTAEQMSSTTARCQHPIIGSRKPSAGPTTLAWTLPSIRWVNRSLRLMTKRSLTRMLRGLLWTLPAQMHLIPYSKTLNNLISLRRLIRHSKVTCTKLSSFRKRKMSKISLRCSDSALSRVRLRWWRARWEIMPITACRNLGLLREVRAPLVCNLDKITIRTATLILNLSEMLKKLQLVAIFRLRFRLY